MTDYLKDVIQQDTKELSILDKLIQDKGIIRRECSTNKPCNQYYQCPKCQLIERIRIVKNIGKEVVHAYPSIKFSYIAFKGDLYKSFNNSIFRSIQTMNRSFNKGLINSRWFNINYDGYFKSYSIEYDDYAKAWFPSLTAVLFYSSRIDLETVNDAKEFTKKCFLLFNIERKRNPFRVISADTNYIGTQSKLELLYYSSSPFSWNKVLINTSLDQYNDLMKGLKNRVNFKYEFFKGSTKSILGIDDEDYFAYA